MAISVRHGNGSCQLRCVAHHFHSKTRVAHDHEHCAFFVAHDHEHCAIFVARDLHHRGRTVESICHRLAIALAVGPDHHHSCNVGVVAVQQGKESRR